MSNTYDICIQSNLDLEMIAEALPSTLHAVNLKKNHSGDYRLSLDRNHKTPFVELRLSDTKDRKGPLKTIRAFWVLTVYGNGDSLQRGSMGPGVEFNKKYNHWEKSVEALRGALESVHRVLDDHYVGITRHVYIYDLFRILIADQKMHETIQGADLPEFVKPAYKGEVTCRSDALHSNVRRIADGNYFFHLSDEKYNSVRIMVEGQYNGNTANILYDFILTPSVPVKSDGYELKRILDMCKRLTD